MMGMKVTMRLLWSMRREGQHTDRNINNNIFSYNQISI
jgi:hypothetical protein